MNTWSDQKLGDIFDIDTTPCNPSKHPTQLFRHLSIPAWDETGGPIFEFGSAIDSNKFHLTRRCIVVSKLNPRIPRVMLLDPREFEEPICASTELIAYCPKTEDTSLEFFGHYFRTQQFRSMLERFATGTTNSHVRLRPQDTLNWSFPLPCPEEQRAITLILDAADAAIEATREAHQSAFRLRAAILQRFLTDALGTISSADRPGKTIKAGWRLVPSGELLAEEPKNGISPPAESQPPGNPTFSIAAVRNGRIDLANHAHLKYVRIEPRIASKFAVREGDILVVRGNANADLVGKCGVISGFPTGCIYPDILKRITFSDRKDGMVPQYAALVWNHPLVHNQILKRAKTSNGTLKINSRDVKQIVLPVPPKNQQQELIRLISAEESLVDSLSRRVDGLLKLKRGLLQDLLPGTVLAHKLLEFPRT